MSMVQMVPRTASQKQHKILLLPKKECQMPHKMTPPRSMSTELIGALRWIQGSWTPERTGLGQGHWKTLSHLVVSSELTKPGDSAQEVMIRVLPQC